MRQYESEKLTVAIYSPDIETLRRLVQSRPYDFGCRAHARRSTNGKYMTVALVTRVQYDELLTEKHEVVILFDRIPDDRKGDVTIGRGDRFGGGRRAPQGVGSGGTDDVGGIMNVDEIGSAMTGLVNEYGIPTFDVPNPTSEGSGGKGGGVGGINPDDYHLYLTAGVHARERGGPDSLIYFIADLLFAQKHATGLNYGAKSYSHSDVIKALRTGIVFFPLVNPDGVRWDQRTDSKWRKNRNPASAIPGDPESVGVDVNRNYDFLWDFRRHFASSVTGSTNLASDKPHDETFHGPSVFSEPETRNVAWIFDQFPRLRWYMDIHSAWGDILYSWGSDDDQVSEPSQNFLNPAWDGKRGILHVNDYKEWIDEGDFGKIRTVATRVSGAMHVVGGRPFGPLQASDLFATSGASDDYAFSRFRARPGVNKVYGFTMEFSYPGNFYPTLAEFHQNLQDTGAGLMEFCLSASDVGVV